jgi:diguanylate cyclase (GGDEF)-like protein
VPLVYYLTIASLIIGGLVLGGLCSFTWRRRPANSSSALPVLLAAATLWVLAAAAEHLLPTLNGKIFATKIQYIGALTLPIAAVCTVLAYVGKEKWQWPFLRFALPTALVCLALVLSNEAHHRVWSAIELDTTGAIPLLNLTHGPGFWLINAFSHGQLFFAFALYFINSLKNWRVESGLVYLGFAAPWIANLIYVSGWSPIANLDITPFGLIVTGVIFTISFHGVGSIFSTVKLAHRDIVESIADLILVVDERKQLLSANQSARVLLVQCPLPAPISVVFANHPGLLAYLEKGAQSDHQDVEVERAGNKTTFDLRSVNTVDSNGRKQATVYVLRDATQERERERMLRFLASTDPLTNLPNRREFQRVLDKSLIRAVGSGRRVALLSLDLDRFKMVNDNHGHPAGDDILRQVADRLRNNLRPTDQVAYPPAENEGSEQVTVSRHGGDEFMIFLPILAAPGDASHVARRLIAALEEPFQVGSGLLQLGASIGIAIGPDDGGSSESLVRCADKALHSVKQSLRGSFAFYNSSLSAVEERRHALEQALRRALVRDEFKMHYQPICDTQTSGVCGAEALLRWHSAELGAVSADEFIPVAEESGLIVRVGEVVLRSVCEQIAQWRSEGLVVPTISVNLSARQLIDLNFPELVERVFFDTGVCGSDIEFELTEGSMLTENPRADETLAWLRELGASLALDDFGTGYSSLSHLRRFSFQRLKVDRSFVVGLGSAPEDERLVRGVIALAHRLNIETVAEGVETQEQLDILRKEGCNYIQGFLLGRPEPPELFERLLYPAASKLADCVADATN